MSSPDEVKKIDDTAVAEFGQIDTWVNNAAVSMYGKAFEIPVEDMRRHMDTPANLYRPVPYDGGERGRVSPFE